MKDRLTRIWKLQGGFDIMDIDNGFYMVKFDLAEDREKVSSGGPWMIFDHYLAVTHWTPEFVSPAAKIERTLVWICFPGLNLVYYDESFLLAMASTVGKPIRMDTNTLKVERGRFARICVEIDLTQPVVGKVWLYDHWYNVTYEGLHIICTSCGRYGHYARSYKHSQPQQGSTLAPAAKTSGQPKESQDNPPQPEDTQPEKPPPPPMGSGSVCNVGGEANNLLKDPKRTRTPGQLNKLPKTCQKGRKFFNFSQDPPQLIQLLACWEGHQGDQATDQKEGGMKGLFLIRVVLPPRILWINRCNSFQRKLL